MNTSWSTTSCSKPKQPSRSPATSARSNTDRTPVRRSEAEAGRRPMRSRENRGYPVRVGSQVVGLKRARGGAWMKVVVVGGGHNGLVCAAHVAAAGVEVTVLEH